MFGKSFFALILIPLCTLAKAEDTGLNREEIVQTLNSIQSAIAEIQSPAPVCSEQETQFPAESVVSLLCRDPYLAICGKKSGLESFFAERNKRVSHVESLLDASAAHQAARAMGFKANSFLAFLDHSTSDQAMQVFVEALELVVLQKVGDENSILESVKSSLSKAVSENNEIPAKVQIRMLAELNAVKFMSTREFITTYGYSALAELCGRAGQYPILGNFGPNRKSVFVCPGVWIHALSTVDETTTPTNRVNEYLFAALSHEVGHRFGIDRYPSAYRHLKNRLGNKFGPLSAGKFNEITADYWSVRSLAIVIAQQHANGRPLEELANSFMIHSYLENLCLPKEPPTLLEQTSSKSMDFEKIGKRYIDAQSRLNLYFGNSEMRNALHCDKRKLGAASFMKF